MGLWGGEANEKSTCGASARGNAVVGVDESETGNEGIESSGSERDDVDAEAGGAVVVPGAGVGEDDAKLER